MYISDIAPYATEEWRSGEDSGLSSAKKKDDELGRNQFLKLLVAQLQHQDPLNPLDGTDFAAQLAQFSSLEQLFDMNKVLAGIQQSLDTQGSENVLDYIGKTVVSGDNDTIFVSDGKPVGGTYNLETGADVTVRIYDSDGFEVCTVPCGRQDPGEYSVGWNGTDSNGNIVNDGDYTYTIEALNKQGYAIPVKSYLVGEVTGITYSNGKSFLMIGDKLIAADNIVEVRKSIES
ncbi:MAG: flagellar hook assembly protein FlgD [Pseudomonadota bacterium]